MDQLPPKDYARSIRLSLFVGTHLGSPQLVPDEPITFSGKS